MRERGTAGRTATHRAPRAGITGFKAGLGLSLVCGLALPLAMRGSGTAEPPVTVAARPVTPRQVSPDISDMVHVPSGWFRMGSGEFEHEMPERSVFLEAYHIDRHEVTNRRFAAFVEATAYRTDAERLGRSWVWGGAQADWVEVEGAGWRHPLGPGSSIDDRPDHPVVQVSWNDARAFCAWAGKRLPSEAEWEKAARGMDGRRFPWGHDEPVDVATLNFADRGSRAGDVPWAHASLEDDFLHTAPVGSFPGGVSPYGLHDAAGNAWEWCEDWFDEAYYRQAPDRNPAGPATGTARVLRGGGYFDFLQAQRCSTRFWKEPGVPFMSSGFRCAMSVR